MLRIKITRKGFLEIKRNNEFKPQFCCRQKITGTDDIKCGDWCPLFGEPVDVMSKDRKRIERQTLSLCQTTLTGRVNDNRGEE